MEDIAYYKEQFASFKSMFAMTTKHLQKVQKELKEANDAMAQSVAYAEKIQAQMLPKWNPDDDIVKEHYMFIQKRDIIGGDFLYVKHLESVLVFGLMDCTGHGIPGSLLSMMGYNFLNDIILHKNVLAPDIALKLLDERIHEYFQSEKNSKVMNDGMDGILCVYDKESKQMHYAMAGRPLWIKQNNTWEKIRPDQNAIGGSLSKTFVKHTINLEANDEVFIFSDGLSDQFGGSRNKKFLTKRILQHLLSNEELNIKEKGEKLKNEIIKWKGKNEQTDDISYLSIRF